VWWAVAVGGALGALARWVVGEWVLTWSGPSGTFPWDTLIVNVVGCALIGFLAPIVMARSVWFSGLVITGFLGGFTTYSAFAEEAFALADRADAAGIVLAGVYVLVTIATTAAAVAIGSRLSPGKRPEVAR
jgi:CrcB protein